MDNKKDKTMLSFASLPSDKIDLKLKKDEEIPFLINNESDLIELTKTYEIKESGEFC